MKPQEWDNIADDYFEIIESPFEKGVLNPLIDELNDISLDLQNPKY